MVHFEMKLISILGTEKSRKTKFKICDLKPGNDGYGWDFMNWEDMENQFLIDDSIRMECHVELKYIERTSYRKFDESAKEFSDVILVAEKQKFYVSKLVRIVKRSSSLIGWRRHQSLNFSFYHSNLHISTHYFSETLLNLRAQKSN